MCTIKNRKVSFSCPLGVYLDIIPNGGRFENDIVLARGHFLVDDWRRVKAEPGLFSRETATDYNQEMAISGPLNLNQKHITGEYSSGRSRACGVLEDKRHCTVGIRD